MYSTAVANDKEKYIALDLGNPNAMKEYFEVDKSTYNKYENGKRKFNNDVVKQLA